MKELSKYTQIYIFATTLWLFLFSLFLPIVPLNVTLIVTVVLAVAGLVLEKRATLDIGFWLLVVIFGLTGFIDFHNYVEHGMYFVIILPLSYLIGKLVVGSKKEGSEARAFTVLLGLTFGSLIQGLLNYYNEYQEKEFPTEIWEEFWTKKPDISRCLFEIYFIFFTCLFVWAIVEFKKKKALSIIIMVAVLATHVLIAKSEGRMNTGILFGVILITIAVMLLKKWKVASEKTKSVIKRGLLIVIAIVALFAIIFSFNIFGIKDLYLNSYLNSSGGILHNIRFQMMFEGLKIMTTNFRGGWKIEVGKTLGLINSTWFLFAQDYGVIIFFFLVVFVLSGVVNCIRFLPKVKTAFDYWVVALFAGYNVYFLLETCPWRYRSYFIFLLTICGVLRGKLELESDNAPKEIKWSEIKKYL